MLVSAEQLSGSAICIHTSPFSWTSFPPPPQFHPSRSLQSSVLSSLCYTTGFPPVFFIPSNTAGVIHLYTYTNPLTLPPKEPHLMTETRRYILEASSECQSIWNQRQRQQKAQAEAVPIPSMLLQQKSLSCRNNIFVVVQSLSHVWVFVTPWTVGSSVLHCLPEFPQIHVHGIGDNNNNNSQHLIHAY